MPADVIIKVIFGRTMQENFWLSSGSDLIPLWSRTITRNFRKGTPSGGGMGVKLMAQWWVLVSSSVE